MADNEEGFTPRKSLARTPPSALGRPVALPPPPPVAPAAEKRPLTSPEEVQPSSQRPRVGKRTESSRGVPPVAGLLSREREEPVAVMVGEDCLKERSRGSKGDFKATSATRLEVIDHVRDAVKGIMGIITAPGSKLNKTEVQRVAAYGHDLIAMVATMEIHTSELELAALKAEQGKAIIEARLAQLEVGAAVPCRTMDPAPQKSYSSALRMPKGADKVFMPVSKGPVVAFYPAEMEGPLKTAEDTKAELKKAVNPKTSGIQVDKLRKIGNAGVVVQTTSQEAAEKLKTAAPPSLRVSEPRQRQPLVALRGFEEDPKNEEVMSGLLEQNLAACGWSKEKMKESCKIAFKKTWRGSRRTTVILQCTAALRDALIGHNRLYVGWDVVEPCDYVDVTCCRRCQQYGHPAKYCRSKEVICGKCGEIGHERGDCKAVEEQCATCKRFGRSDSGTHVTMARNCPARIYAEQRSVATTQYSE